MLHDGGRCRVCRGELPRPRPRGPGGGDREGACPPPCRPVPLLPRRVPRPRPRDRERVRRDAPPADAGVVPRAGGDRLHGAVVPGVHEVPPVRGRFLRKEADWERFRFLISDGEMASVREATRHGIPTVAIVHSIGQAFARDLFTGAVEGLGRRWMGALLSRPDVRVLGLEAGIDLPNARYIGPVVRPFSRDRETLRDELVFRKRTVLVAPGGTGIGGFLIDEAVKAWRALNLPEAQMIVVSGPKLKPDPVPGVYYKGFVPNLQDYVLAADLVIAMAGKGTMMEALAAGTPVIAIPPKGHPEAERNLRAFGLRYRFEDAFRLRELIPELLSVVRSSPMDLGPGKAVDEIDAFLRGQGVFA